MRGGGSYLEGLLAKYSIAVRICFLSLQRWTETKELELRGNKRNKFSRGSGSVNKLSHGGFTPKDVMNQLNKTALKINTLKSNHSLCQFNLYFSLVYSPFP